ncbi:sugar phosphate isomerase/epimerase family protein [Gulosibacter chungangensis]|uniref:Sugar phosphate isomerase/epimerase n=1 Tax=Gulosibacter chungangensis TaxID=979746 RepID=A0A7J5BFT8_9MICO|nr:sugar phosphate isomerase/epimerase family protein [Gulosibacter chungangensis]KAB1645141.1 sugar phosphate isomerase/epimerase [Gulosibacter chungangensis]
MFQERFLCASTILEASMRERIDASMAGGYMGLGLRPGHVKRAVEGEHPVTDLYGELQANDLELVEIGFISDWWTLDGDGNAVSLKHEQGLHRLKEDLGARHMMAIGGPLGEGIDAAAARFGAMCRRAAPHGLDVALEFLPWTDTNTLEKAWQIVSESGEPNAKIAFDTWHFFRGGSTLEMLEPIPADRIAVIQLSDGPLNPVTDEMDATFHSRAVPGAGEFPLTTLFDALAAKGVKAPIGVEVLSDALRELSSVAAATAAAKATDRFLAQYQ